jgi:hypothetical protein
VEHVRALRGEQLAFGVVHVRLAPAPRVGLFIPECQGGGFTLLCGVMEQRVQRVQNNSYSCACVGKPHLTRQLREEVLVERGRGGAEGQS